MFSKRLRQFAVLTLSISLVSLMTFSPTLFAQTSGNGAGDAIDTETLTTDNQTPEDTTPGVVAAEIVTAQTESADIATIMTTDPSIFANIRTGPSTNYPVIQTVMPGTLIHVLGQDASTAWLSVRLPDGTEGWVARFLTNYLDRVATTVETPPLAPPATQIGQETGVATIVTAAPNVRVNVRSGPSTTYTILTTVAPDTRVGVMGQDASGTWLSVRLSDGTEGWVARWLTDFAAQVTVVATPPLFQQPPAQPPLAPPAMQIPMGQVPTAPPAGVQLVTDPNIVSVVPVIQTNVNIRSGPSTNHSVIRTVPPSTQLTAIGQDSSNLWIAVRLQDGTQGWIARYLTNFIGTVPVTAQIPGVQQPPLAPPATDAPPVMEVEPGVMALPGERHSLSNPPVEAWLADNWRTLPEGATHWYAFEQPGDSMTIQIWMDSQPHEGAGFRIYDARAAHAIMGGQNPDDFNEIGAGTPNENEPGHLFWRGEFAAHGTYYVMVEHGGLGNVPYTTYSAGPGR
jgi:uncharacterized protein YgiM (DUF1202 family)